MFPGQLSPSTKIAEVTGEFWTRKHIKDGLTELRVQKAQSLQSVEEFLWRKEHRRKFKLGRLKRRPVKCHLAVVLLPFWTENRLCRKFRNPDSTHIDKNKIADNAIVDEILDIYSEITGYPKEMLDLNMEIEADLGIDTVKQATILSMISEKFNIPQEDSVKLSNYPTIGHVVNMVQSKYAKEDNISKAALYLCKK